MMARAVVDFVVHVAGSVVLLTAQSEAARVWCDEHLPEDRARWGLHGTVVEPRYIEAIVEGLEADGYTYRITGAV